MEIEKERPWATMAALFSLSLRFPHPDWRTSFGENDAEFLNLSITVSFAQLRCEQNSAILYNAAEECHIGNENN
jgi:hypothetical protein